MIIKLLKNVDIRKFIVHFVVILILLGIIIAAAVIVFNNSFAWFSANKEVTRTGRQVSVGGPDFEISTLEGGSNGIYYNRYHSLVFDQSALIWQMTDTNNMDNFNSTGAEIYPGSSGVISFYVRPLVDSIDLDFSFEILGYTASEEGDSVTMTQLDPNESPALFLNGHILLFGKRTETDGKYIYDDPILSNADMKRVIEKKNFSGSGVRKQVDIYWVWPQTMSDIIDARNCQKVEVTKTPFTSAVIGENAPEGEIDYLNADANTAYKKVVDNIRTFPEYYCKGMTRPDSEGAKLSENNFVTDYDKYGDYYDLADNDIGMGVHFILLKLVVTKSETSGE